MKAIKYFFSILALFVLWSCSLDDSSSNAQETEYAVLVQQKNIIEQLAISEPCTDSTGCDYVAFGSKPCGGPWTYLAYSTSINVDLFLQKVADFNAAENTYNLKWKIVSDCTVVDPPTSVECVNGICTAIYN
jgi:hypothetical protein